MIRRPATEKERSRLVGQRAIIASDGLLYPKKANKLRGEVGIIEGVGFKNATLRFELEARWHWPMDEIVLESDESFEIIRQQQLEWKARQTAHNRAIQEIALTKRRATISQRGLRRSIRPRDAQRGKVYAWEYKYVTTAPGVDLSLDQCQVWIENMCSALRVPLRIRIDDGRGSSSARWKCRTSTISLPRGLRTEDVLAHELAHAICDAVPRRKLLWLAPHGPEFVGTLIEIHVLLGRSNWQLVTSARESGVVVGQSCLDDVREAWTVYSR